MPNELAVAAAILLLITSVSGFVNKDETDQPITQSTNISSAQSESVSTDTASKKRKLKLSSLLFGQG